jgi:catechol 2,3-dioxygenase-like lactoylglutathione lyase family enzyme
MEALILNGYVNSGEQLVVECYVRNLRESSEFCRALGFEVVRGTGNFVELQGEDSLLFLEEVADAPLPPPHPVGNMRIMVPNVDDFWTLSKKMGAQVIRPIGNRSYGLRDFTIAGPDGLGLRFATHVSDLKESSRT